MAPGTQTSLVVVVLVIHSVIALPRGTAQPLDLLTWKQGTEQLQGCVTLGATWCSRRERTFEEISLNVSFLSSQLATWAVQTKLCPQCAWLVHVPSKPELGQVLLSGLRCCSWSQLFSLQGNRDLLQNYLKTHVALILFDQLCANVS